MVLHTEIIGSIPMGSTVIGYTSNFFYLVENFLFLLFLKFYVFLFIFFVVWIIFSHCFIYFSLIFYVLGNLITKLSLCYYIYRSETFKLNFKFFDIWLSVLFIFLIYFYLFAPIYSLGWLLFYSLKFITCNNVFDFDDIFCSIVQFNYQCWFNLYLAEFMLLYFFFFYSDYYFFILKFLNISLFKFFL